MKTEKPLKCPSVIELNRLRKQVHDRCIACIHPQLKLNFTLDDPYILRTSIDFTDEMKSFNGMVHGGLQAFLIDEAMTCALLGQGICAATGDLKLRYKHPVKVGPTGYIRVWVATQYHRLYYVEAELTQSGTLCTSGIARFIDQTASKN